MSAPALAPGRHSARSQRDGRPAWRRWSHWPTGPIGLAGLTRRLSVSNLLIGAAFILVLGLVAFIHGFAPGESQPMVQTILDSGAIQCLHNEGWHGLTAKCDSVGTPIGLTIITGMPETMLGLGLSWLPGVDSWTAHQLLNVILDGVALGGGYFLLRRWNVLPLIALAAPAAYLVCPSLLGLNGFQYTFTGYAFLPLYLLMFFIGLDHFSDGRSRLAGTSLFGLDCLLMVFTDGYSYATALLLISIALLWWLWRDTSTAWRRKLMAVGVFIVANVFAVLAYDAYINVNPDPHAPLGTFRYFALDPITLVTPQWNLLWPSHIGYTTPTLNLWGDGGNIYYNYMGLVTLGIVAWFLIFRRLRWAVPRGELAALLVGGFVALFLSLGPALKFNSHTVPGVRSGVVPLSQMVIGLPTSFLFAHIPPFDDMRAVFRWSVGFRFVLIFIAAFAIDSIWKAGRHRWAPQRFVAIGLLVVACLEVAPSPHWQLPFNRSSARQVSAVRSQVIAQFDSLTTPGDQVLMLPSNNDFVANAMAPFARVSTYNVGIDKDYAATVAAWPAAVKAAKAAVLTPAARDRIAAVLQADASVVVICYFDLHNSGTYWPAPSANATKLKALVGAMTTDPRFVVVQASQMATVRLRPGA